ncbi:MAG TPA: TonB-dependent receptor [Rhizomicrobium sp.]
MRNSLLLSAALTALAAPAAAQTVAGPVDPYRPETVVVSATRTDQPLRVTGASVSVIDAQDLKTQQTVALTDILQQTPSLVVTRNGGLGQPASISLRGGEAGQTVVLIDGVRVNDPSVTDDSAAAALGDLLVNNIARVEILRGPQSTLYGSNALGGVIDVITKRGGADAIDASVEGGSFGTFHANVAAHGAAGFLEYGAGLNYLTTSGISAADSRFGNPEADGYTNVGATVNLRAHVDDAVSIDLRGYYTRGHDDFDDGFGGPPLFAVADSAANNTNDLKTGYLGANADLFGGVLHNRLAVIATQAGRDFFDSASDVTHLNFAYYASTTRFEYQGIVDIDPDSQVTFGAETEASTFRNDNFGSFAFFSPPVVSGHDRLTGYYAQGQTTLFEQLTLTGGVRLDDDDQFGTHPSYKFNAAWQILHWDATLRANVGNAFKAPSLFQEFGPNSLPSQIGHLKPETATGWEVGADKRLWGDRLTASLTYFERNTTNQIDFQNCFTPLDAPGCRYRVAVFGYYDNIARTRARGVEAELAAVITDTLTAKLAYTNMSSINAVSRLDLPRRPQNLASAVVTWLPLDGATLGFSLTYQGKRFNDAGNFTPLTSATQVNLFASYDVTEHWQLFGRIDNMFNDRTEDVTGYGVAGIGAFGGIRAAL